MLLPRLVSVTENEFSDMLQFHETNPRMGEYIDRYVFPGGYLPTPNILFDSLHRGSKGSLEVTSVLSSGPHYGKTLLGWRDNFLEKWEDIRSDFYTRHPEASGKEVEAYRRRWLVSFPNHTLRISRVVNELVLLRVLRSRVS